MNLSKLPQYAFFLPALLALAIYFYPNNFELYPRVGWTDAGMYLGYIHNDNLIRDFGFTANKYQGSRLGYIVPAKYFLTLFNPILGRYLFVLSFYIIGLISLFVLVRCVAKRVEIQSLFMTVTICNPLLLAGLSYGGADGPAAIYTIISGVFLYLTVYTHKFSLFFLMLAGFFSALSISTHILAFVPLAVIFFTYLFLQNKVSKNILVIGITFALTIFFLSIFGHHLGMKKNFLLYSYDWSAKSVSSSGISYRQPIKELIYHWIIYIPPFFLSAVALKFLINYKGVFRGNIFLVSAILATSPLLFFLLFDLCLGGAISQYLSYYLLLYPCFIFSFLFLLASEKISISKYTVVFINFLIFTLFILSILNIEILISVLLILSLIIFTKALTMLNNSQYVKKLNFSYLIIILFTAQYFCFAYNKNIIPFYKSTGSANTEELYKSELQFITTINKIPRAYGLPNFIYDSTKKNDELISGQFYQIYFNGEKRIYDYFDSLTALYLRDRSILTNNLKSSDFESIIKKSNKSKSIVLLGRNEVDVDNMYARVSAILSDLQPIISQCYQSKTYPWCIKVAKEFPAPASKI